MRMPAEPAVSRGKKKATCHSPSENFVDGANGITASQVLNSVPNPLFILDARNCFLYLNQASEMFFQSSQLMLFGVPLDRLIPRDASLFLMLKRAREQNVTVSDQGLDFAGPKLGLKLVNVQITPFGEMK